ncbi:MAP6 domain-containing protein 1 [Paroedura picta]|uniref:MAP6 domain-containing protein 1 n=1 Tax=Paroedura picta TaxID=143630 RepID=UPI0040566E43
MAWPCITRVCCLARFWNQLDKSDLAVPLTIHNYSDIEEAAAEGAGAAPQPGIPTGGGRGRPLPPGRPRPASALPVSASAPSLHDSLAGGKRPSRKGRGGGRRKESFAAETQYQQDFRAWPVQKRDALPWLGEGRRGELRGAPSAAAPAPAVAHGGSRQRVYVVPATEREAGRKHGAFKQLWSAASPPGLRRTTSYRQEYRPWTGAKRARASKMKQAFIIPEDHFVKETSYKADFKIPEVEAKFSPNPSAVFHAPSRILNV